MLYIISSYRCGQLTNKQQNYERTRINERPENRVKVIHA